MAITTRGIDTAIWHMIFESGNPSRQLPWARMRFGDVGEEGNYYIVPLPPSMAIQADIPAVTLPAMMTTLSGRVSTPDHAPFAPFPFEGGRAALTNTRDDVGRPGPIGVNFFGGV